MKQLVLFLVFIGVSFSQTTRFTVRNLEVEGNVRTDASTIRINSGLYIGKKFTVQGRRAYARTCAWLTNETKDYSRN